MKLSLPRKYIKFIAKAIAEFNLIEDKDRILVGFSGGKDSAFLLYALKVLQKSLAMDFELTALTIDLGFPQADFSKMEDFCSKLEVPFYIKKTEIAEYIMSAAKNPCAKCAHFRRGAIAEFMLENNYQKVAVGHHYDDAVETFLMSILYSGQILTMQPLRHLENNDLYIIRPLIYLREKNIRSAYNLFEYRPSPSPCPYDGQTKRQEIKEKLKEFTYNKQVFYNLAKAMRQGSPQELWPEELGAEELSQRLKRLWFG